MNNGIINNGRNSFDFILKSPHYNKGKTIKKKVIKYLPFEDDRIDIYIKNKKQC